MMNVHIGLHRCTTTAECLDDCGEDSICGGIGAGCAEGNVCLNSGSCGTDDDICGGRGAP